jgi:3-mercaptopyruvate sulfurtransferase SseA
MSFNSRPVTAEWLLANQASVKIIDGSWAMRANRHAEYATKRIPGYIRSPFSSQFFCCCCCTVLTSFVWQRRIL